MRRAGARGVARLFPLRAFQRAAGAWQAEWDALSGALASTGGAAAALAESLETLEVDTERMRSNLELTRGGVVAERVALHLTERVGRTRARALVRDASLRAAEAGTSLAQVSRIGFCRFP